MNQQLKTTYLWAVIILKIKFFIFLLFLNFLNNLYGQVALSQELDQLKKQGIFLLEDVTVKRIKKDKVISKTNFSQSLKKIVLKLIEENDEKLIKKLALEIDPNLIEENDLTVLKKRVLEVINPPQKSIISEKENVAIQEKKLFSDKKTLGIILNKADIIELSEITVDGKREKKIVLEGNVLIGYENGSIEGDKLTINLATKEVFGKGNIKLSIDKNLIIGDEIIFKIKEEQGYINNASGLQEGNYFKVKTFRINSREHFTLEDGWVTFSKNDDPYYHIYFQQVDIYGKEKSIFVNPVAKVHNHGFFWIPVFNRYPLSASLNLAFGETRREGLYFLINTVFFPPLLKKLDVTFNIYEKLGYYFNLVNKNSIFNSDYKLDFTGVYYTRNENTKQRNKLSYTHNTSPYITSQSQARYKIAYQHDFNLFKTKDNKVKSNLKFSMNNSNDPLLVDIFSRSLALDHLDITRLIERHDRDESLYTLPSRPSNNDDFYKINYSLSAPRTSLTVNLNWQYKTYDDSNNQDGSIDERYKKYLKEFTLPSIVFNHSGVFDPNADNSLLHFNINYSLGLNYLGKSTFKDGSPLDSGSGNFVSIKPFELIQEDYALKLSSRISRPFSFDKNEYSLLNFNQDWLSWDVVPQFSVSYDKNWQGKNFSLATDRGKDTTVLRLNYSLSSSIDILNSVASFISWKFNNKWSLTDERRTESFNLAVNNNIPETENRKFSSAYSVSIPFDFPSSFMKKVWARSDGYESMLPTFDLDFSYSFNKRTTEDKISTQPLALDIIDRRDFSVNLKGQHKGFGFLYIPYLNYTLSTSVFFKYDLIPIKNEEGNVITKDIFTDSRFWHENRITGFKGSSQWNFNFNLSPVKTTFNNSLNYDFYDNTLNRVSPELKLYSAQYTFSVTSLQKNNLVDLNFFSFNYNFNYYFQEESYLSDSMSFSFTTNLRIINVFNFVVEFTTVNSDSHLYFKEKANFLSRQPVNFFEDIYNSFGFAGLKKQRESLFKIKNISFAINHDLDDWQASFKYTFIPVSFVEDSFRGFYYDHVVSFEVNLKPEKDPRGPKNARNNPFFDDINRNFTPIGF